MEAAQCTPQQVPGYSESMMRNDLLPLQEQVTTVLVGRNSHEKVVLLHDTLVKLVANIESHPHDPKYRRIKRSNPAIAERVLSLYGGEHFLLVLGWEEEAGGFFDFPSTADLLGLQQGMRVLGSMVAPRKDSVAKVVGLAGVDRPLAACLLEETGWDVESAIALHFDRTEPTGSPTITLGSPLVSGFNTTPAPAPAPPTAPKGERKGLLLRDGPEEAAASKPCAAASSVAVGCAQLVGRIATKQHMRSQRSNAASESAEAACNAVVEKYFLCKGAGAASGVTSQGLATAADELYKIRSQMASVEGTAVATLNIISALVGAHGTSHPDLRAEVRALEGLVKQLGGDESFLRMIHSFTGAPAPPQPEAAAGLPAALAFISSYNAAVSHIGVDAVSALIGFATALRAAKEVGWSEGAALALSGIAAGNLAVGSVGGAENAVRQRRELGKATTPLVSRLSALSFYGRFAVEVSPFSLPLGTLSHAVGSACTALRHGPSASSPDSLPLTAPAVVFRFS